MFQGRSRPREASSILTCFLAFVVAAFFINVCHLLRFAKGPRTQRMTRIHPSRINANQLSASGRKIERHHRYIAHKPLPRRTNYNSASEPISLVKSGDYIYYKQDELWDSSPIVLESHKLVFFTIPKVGCTVWKQLFRRMMGFPDWQSQDGEILLPHNPEHNGLKYLYNYTVDEANNMMTSAEWTRAMMIREPKQRFLSAFLDKSISNDHAYIVSKCCPDRSCVEDAQTLEGFLRLASICHNEHWRPQNLRVDYKYWPFIDFVAHVENAAQDAKTLLMKIGAWDDFGKDGWGSDKKSPIFGSKEVHGAGIHATWADSHIWQWYTPELEEEVERFYRGDYENPLFNFTEYKCFTCS